MHSNTQNALRSVTKIVYNAYVDIDCVTEPSGPDCANWIEITKIKLQERESKLLTIIKHKIESIVSETYPTSGATQPTPQPATLSHPRSFIVSSYAMNVTSSVLAKSINGWKGINLSRLKHSPTVYRDYFNVSKKSWDRRKTKFFGSSLWVNVFKEIHHFVYMDLFRLIQILKALFSATIRCNNTRLQPLINGMVIANSSELHQYFNTLDLSFRMDEWNKERKKNARSLHQKMQSHLDYILDNYNNSTSVSLTAAPYTTQRNYTRRPDLPPAIVRNAGGYCASRQTSAAPRPNALPYCCNHNPIVDGIDLHSFYDDTFTEYL
eukprot:111313_1